MIKMVFKIKKNSFSYKGTSIILNPVKKKICIKGSLGIINKKLSGTDLLFVDTSLFFLSKCSFKTFLALMRGYLDGVTVGYFFELTFVGLGYRFLHINNFILLKVGFAHYIKIEIPSSVHVFGYKKRLVIFGIDMNIINRFLNELRSFKRPDSYKGKGIRLEGEFMVLKVGKQKL